MVYSYDLFLIPQDTLYISGDTILPHDIDSFIDSIENISPGNNHLQQKLNERPQYPFPEWQMFLVILAVLLLSVYLYILRPSRVKKRKRINRYRRNSGDSLDLELQYDNWLSKYNPYYNSLPAEGKRRFLQRTRRFMEAKEFRFHAMVEEEYIPVLISGAAVQMTFGLTNYLMDYFPVIHIIRKEYVLNVDKETYYGHVSRNGIYISWSSFLEGYEDYGDSVNVGLHEMAHAVSYDIFLGHEDREDYQFKQRLQKFSKEGTLIFRAMCKGEDTILDDYARTNFDEFWAVSIETFFENSQQFKAEMPHLYRAISELLNQDPTLHNKIVG